MRRLLMVISAAVLSIAMLTGCDPAAETKKKYEQDASDLQAFMSEPDYRADVKENVTGFFTSYNKYMSELAEYANILGSDANTFSVEYLETMKSIADRNFGSCKVYLSKLERLSAPSTVSDFHKDLLAWTKSARSFMDANITMYSAKTEEEFLNAAETATELANTFNEKLLKAMETDWFNNVIESLDLDI